jgi:hypothetical protein
MATQQDQITRADIQGSLNAYAELMKSASKFNRKLLELSQASVEFGASLESLSKCKGSEQSGKVLALFQW